MNSNPVPILDDLATVSIQQLRYLAAIAGGATFADIAADLDITQSALSQGVARLESLLGVQLVEPIGRRRRVTAVGRDVAGHAIRMLGIAEELVDLATQHIGGSAGRLRVGMVDAGALYLFGEAIASFHAERPEVELGLVVDDSQSLLDRLAQFRDELAVVVGPAPSFDSIPLATEELNLYGPTGDPSSGSWVLYPSESHTRRSIDQGLRTLDLTPQAVIESGNPEVQGQLALLTDSWTVLPAGVADQLRDPLTLRHRAVATRTFVIARRQGSRPSILADYFVEALLAT